jgi:CubicO group peptidase (beta-lactamase class C family)
VPANAGWQPRLTLRQLLSHTGGLTVHGFPGYQASEKLPTVIQVLNGEAPANTARVEVNLLPGTQFRYSGGGTTVAQQVVVEVLGEPFPQIMRDLVFEPLGLAQSSYEQPLPPKWAKRAATAHPWKGIPLKGKFHTYPEMAAAGLWTTPSDLATIGVELLKALHGEKAPTLLSNDSVSAMLRPQLDHQKVGEGEFVGLGFFCNGKDEGFHFGHGGWDEGFVAQMRVYPSLGKGAVVMVNSNEGYPLMDEILRAIGQAYEWPNALPKPKIAVDLPDLRPYTGLYATSAGTRFQIDLLGDGLALQYGPQAPVPILPSSELEFFAQALNLDLRFEKDDKSGTRSLTISQDGSQIRAERQRPLSR